MPPAERRLRAVMRDSKDRGYEIACAEISVTARGKTVDEAVQNLQAAVRKHFDREGFDFRSQHTSITIELRVDMKPIPWSKCGPPLGRN